MIEPIFGNIESVDLRSVWPGEATHFTPWLSNHLDIISDKLDLELELIDTEVAAGGFAADIYAIDISTNRTVIIENQFGSTDHRHLGQILTYASTLEADAIIWIAETIRPEHKATIDFLNKNLKSSLLFYALELSLIKIDNSAPAFILNIISSPKEKPTISAGEVKENTERAERYRTFYQSLLNILREKHHFTNARAGQPQNWYTFSSENSRVFKYSTSFALGNKFRTEVYIDTGDQTKNESLFDFLFEKKEEIESKYGLELTWEKLETKRGCRVAAYIDGSIDDDTEQLEEVEKWAVTNLLKMKQVFPKYIQKWVDIS